MLRDIASEVYTAMRGTAQWAPDTQAATPNPARPGCLVGYAADAADQATQSSVVCILVCCIRQAASKPDPKGRQKFVAITATEMMTEINSGARVLSMRTARTLLRDWCTATGDSWSDLNGRWRAVREAGGSPKGAGRHTPPATLQDAAVMILAPLVAPLWKNVPAGIQRYGNLIVRDFQVSAGFRNRFGEEMAPTLGAKFENCTLLDTLMVCLQTFRSDTEIRFLTIGIEQSDYEPRASLVLGDPSTRACSFVINFAEREGPREGVLPEPRVHIERFRGGVLTVMADLLADNLQGTHENGPSVDADEPLPSDETPRAGKPATTDSHPEARRERDKSQVSFESYGESSGGAPLPPTESPYDYRPKCYG
jgi:hypothetical protein